MNKEEQGYPKDKKQEEDDEEMEEKTLPLDLIGMNIKGGRGSGRKKGSGKKLTSNEKRIFNEIVSTHGGKENVDLSKVRARVLSYRKRKTNRITARDMEDMMGY